MQHVNINVSMVKQLLIISVNVNHVTMVLTVLHCVQTRAVCVQKECAIVALKHGKENSVKNEDAQGLTSTARVTARVLWSRRHVSVILDTEVCKTMYI